MIEIKQQTSAGFSTQITYEGWKVAFITFSQDYNKMEKVKRHLATDETFLLVKGRATLYVSDEQVPQNFVVVPLKKQNLYNVKQNTWHHLKVSKRAKVLVVENSNTTKENTQTYFLKDDK